MSKRKILALLLAVVMVCSLFVSPALAADDEGIVAISDTVAPKFTDADGHWAESAIVRWAEAGIIEGDGDGTINPARSLKRAELATILVRLLGLKDTAPADTFSDVAANAWYADAVLKCAKAGIMLGDGSGKANPEAPISRQEAIVMIGRALGVKPATGHSLDRFDDGDTVADWATPYMIALTDMKILSGLPTGEGDGAIVAPTVNIDRASTFTLLDKAIAQYITAPCTATVDDANKFVVINSAAEEAGTVTVTGTTAGVVVAIGTTDDVVLNKADVGTLKVDAPVDVTVNRGSSVDDLDANAAAKIDNQGTVTNLNTNADGVVFDGNKPAEVNTAKDVEPAKDSKGNEVTNAPASSGSTGGGNGGGTTTSYDVTVTLVKNGNGVATLTNANQNATTDAEGNKVFEEVTLTAIPDAQKGNVMPYVVRQIALSGPAGMDVDNFRFELNEDGIATFTPWAAGKYVVTVDFEQPITEAALFIADGKTHSHTEMEAFGYPENDVNDEQLAEAPYIFLGIKRAEYFADLTAVVTGVKANGATVSQPAGWGNFGHYVSAYVNEKHADDPHTNPDRLGFTDEYATFEISFTMDGADYKLTTDYTAPGADPDKKVDVTIKGADDTVLNTMVAAKGSAISLPNATMDGWYTTGKWIVGETKFEGNSYTIPADLADNTLEIKADGVKIGNQELADRPNGPAEGVASFNYGQAYANAGVKLTGTAGNYTYTVNAERFLAYAAQEDNDLAKLAHEMEDGTTYYFYGAGIKAPAGATKLVVAKNVADLDNEANSSTYEQGSIHFFDGAVLNYFGAVAEQKDGVYGFQKDGSFTRYTKWMNEGTVLAVNKFVLKRVTTAVPKLDVTFKLEGAAEGKDVLYTAEKAVEYGATKVPEEVKNAARAEIAKKYSNVTIEFGAMTNYTVPVTLTTNVKDLIVPTTGNLGLGDVTAEDIQDITLGQQDTGSIPVTGSLYYTEWPEFSSIQNERAGYYAALSIKEDLGTKATVKYNGTALAWSTDLNPFVTIMGEENDTNFTGKGVRLEIDLDGEGPIKPAEYVYNFSDVKAVRWDTRNAETGSAELRKDDVNVEYADSYYANFVVKDEDGKQINMSQDHVVAILKETEDGNIVQFAMEKVTEGNQTSWVPAKDNTILIDEHDNNDPHDMGMTLKQGAEEASEVWYFFVKEKTGEEKETVKCVKVTFNVPAAPAAQTPDQGEESTASLSAVETEEVAAPVDAIVPADDEVAEIPVLD